MAICSVAFPPLMMVRYLVLVAFLTVLALPGAAWADERVRCAPFTQGDPPEPTPRTDRPALDRLEQINQAVTNIPHPVLFLGDSLTEGWDPEVWEENLDPRGVLNAGISGDRTDHLSWRLENGNPAGPLARAVILLIGTNDLSFGRSPELTADGIRANLIALRQLSPETRVLVLGLLPREEAPTAPLRLAVGRVNRLIRDCADNEHIFYADIGDVLLDNTGRLNAAISPDWLHFTARGYALLASSLDPLLDRLLAAPR